MPCYECKRECLSELIGTYLLVLVGPGTVIVVSGVSKSELSGSTNNYWSVIRLRRCSNHLVLGQVLDPHQPSNNCRSRSCRCDSSRCADTVCRLSNIGRFVSRLDSTAYMFQSVDSVTNLGSTKNGI